MTTIKEAVLSTINEHIDSQNAKGLEKYGRRLEDCDFGSYDWQQMIIEELIDGLQYQQMENRKLRQELKTAESFGEMYRLMHIQNQEGN